MKEINSAEDKKGPLFQEVTHFVIRDSASSTAPCIVRERRPQREVPRVMVVSNKSPYLLIEYAWEKGTEGLCCKETPSSRRSTFIKGGPTAQETKRKSLDVGPIGKEGPLSQKAAILSEPLSRKESSLKIALKESLLYQKEPLCCKGFTEKRKLV